MYVEIIPVRRMPKPLTILDYAVPENLESKIHPGQLVRIPFLNTQIFGIIKTILKKEHQKNLKTIVDLVNIEPFITPEQMSFLEELAEFYQTPLGFLLKNNLLPLQKRKLKKIMGLNTVEKNKNNTPAVKPILEIYKNNLEHQEKILRLLSDEGQTLILTPEITDIKNIVNFFPAELQKKIAVISSDLGDKDFFALWLEIWQGKKNIIIGTRRALFLPWNNLQTIILEDEANPNHKNSDMAPRLHNRDAVISLAYHHRAQLYLFAHTPSIETYFFAKNNIYKSSKLLVAPFLIPEVINMKDERKLGNYSCLGEEVQKKIKETKDGDCFFFLNRLGSANFISCADCNYVFKCEKCQKPLTYSYQNKNLRCGRCLETKKLETTCPQCQSLNLKFWGQGTEGLESEIKKIVKTHSLPFDIVRIDREKENIPNEHTSFKNKIIIGTQKAWSQINWEKIKLMVFVDADMTLFVPEFKMNEQLYYSLRDASYRLNPLSLFFVQTSQYEHRVFNCFQNPQNFFAWELSERKKLLYPPYCYLVKLFMSQTNQILSNNIAKKDKEKLVTLTKNGFTGKIYGPFEPTSFTKNGLYSQIILAKISYKTYKKDTRILARTVSSAWKIDPNPNTILSL